jgi:hypothetical protein
VAVIAQVDVKEHLPRIEAQARTERDEAAKRFVYTLGSSFRFAVDHP